ncbi:MAG: type IV toxin-antitoxin system AbiEi family antitoxin [Terriglobia bacterium]
MQQRATETELLEKAIEAFRQATGINLHLQRWEPRQHGQRADVELRLGFAPLEKRFCAQVKRRVNPQTLGQAIEQMKRFPEKALLVTEYVNANMAERLKQMDVPFLDTLGNAYVNAPPIFVYMKGNKPPVKMPAEKPTRAFVPAGLRVVFALLCRQELADAPFRTIAQAANVALGTVAWVLNDLERLGHLLEMGKSGRRLIRKQQLLEHWVAAFPNQLRPKLLLGKYAAPDPKWWEQVRISDFRAYWGAEIAAARLTGYLKPELATVYIRDLPGRFLTANRLRTDARGNVEVLEAFWNTRCDWTNTEIVHPLLVYADLLATGGARNLDTARRIYDEQLAGLVRED